MVNYSEAHICQCLSRLAAASGNSIITVNGDRRKTGMQFVEGVLGLARGLLQLGIKPGDVVSISALNRFAFNLIKKTNDATVERTEIFCSCDSITGSKHYLDTYFQCKLHNF